MNGTFMEKMLVYYGYNGIFMEYQWKINGILMDIPSCVIKHP